MRVAVYARVSGTRQAQAQTIEQQLDRLREAVAGAWLGAGGSACLPCDGYSGASLGRAGLDGCGIMQRWPIWTWSWSPRQSGCPATTYIRCC